jgi:hypothetical protein
LIFTSYCSFGCIINSYWRKEDTEQGIAVANEARIPGTGGGWTRRRNASSSTQKWWAGACPQSWYWRWVSQKVRRTSDFWVSWRYLAWPVTQDLWTLTRRWTSCFVCELESFGRTRQRSSRLRTGAYVSGILISSRAPPRWVFCQGVCLCGFVLSSHLSFSLSSRFFFAFGRML